MEFYVEIKEHAQKFLQKTDYAVKEQILKAIQSLKRDPTRKGKCLGRSTREAHKRSNFGIFMT